MLPYVLRGRGWAEHASGEELFRRCFPLAGQLMHLSIKAAVLSPCLSKGKSSFSKEIYPLAEDVFTIRLVHTGPWREG